MSRPSRLDPVRVAVAGAVTLLGCSNASEGMPPHHTQTAGGMAGAAASAGSNPSGNAGRSGAATGGGAGRDLGGGGGAVGGAGTSGTAGTTGTGAAEGRGAAPAGTGGTASESGRSGSGGAAGSGAGASGAGTAGAGGASAASGGAGGDAGSAPRAWIENDVFWRDTSGDPIYSQGGGVLKVGSKYYWYGVHYAGAETYAANPTKSNSDTRFVAVTVYSSTDLATWTFEGNALTYDGVADKLSMSSSTWIGRVGAAYNATSGKYVIVGQYLGTPDTQQFFATSDTPNGTFVVDHTQPTIENVTNDNCGDQSVFTDDDGAAYVLCSSLSGRSNTYIVPLRAADFLEALPATKIFGGAGREGNAMFKVGGRYYVCSSDLHGWNASHTYCISSTNILGPYDAEAVMGNTDLDFSHVTQTGLFITVDGTAEDTVVFGGDRWSDFAGNGIGYNQWMPLTFEGTSPVMQSVSEWAIDTTTGSWSVGPNNNYALNPSFEADRVATNPPAGWATSGGDDVTSTRTGAFAWQLSGAASVEQELVNLPNGSYTLSAWARGTGSGSLFAREFGDADASVPLSAGSTWTEVTLAGIAVKNGKCRIGATTTTGTITVDDFTLKASP